MKIVVTFFFVLALFIVQMGLVGCEADGLQDVEITQEEIDAAIAEANASDVSGDDSSDSDVGCGSSGSSTFLWKPVSENDGNLVVLLPCDYRGSVLSCGIFADASGTSLIEAGSFTTDDKNGNRVHYRFDNPGAAYGTGIYVVAFLSDGSTLSWAIADGANRTEY